MKVFAQFVAEGKVSDKSIYDSIVANANMLASVTDKVYRPLRGVAGGGASCTRCAPHHSRRAGS
jgi:hypothetical protein